MPATTNRRADAPVPRYVRLASLPPIGFITNAQVKQVLITNLSLYRRKRNLFQRQVAEQAGILLSSYGAYEEGRAEPSFSVLQRLAGVFGISVEELIMPNA
jgi:DNA-binding XRE family transcriptional regulator